MAVFIEITLLISPNEQSIDRLKLNCPFVLGLEKEERLVLTVLSSVCRLPKEPMDNAKVRACLQRAVQDPATRAINAGYTLERLLSVENVNADQQRVHLSPACRH